MLSIAKRIYFQLLRTASTFYARTKLARCGRGLTVNYPCAFTRNSYVGNDCHFNGMKVVGAGRFEIGDHFHSGSEILVLTQNHNYFSPSALPYDELDLPGDVRIGNAVWVGSRVTILPKAVIEDGAVIQAGAVVSGRVPRGAVYGGNPATLIKLRDIERFNRLEAEGKYVNWHE